MDINVVINFIIYIYIYIKLFNIKIHIEEYYASNFLMLSILFFSRLER